MNTMIGDAMSKSSLTKSKKKMRKSSDQSPKSFMSLPYDVVLNCLSRVSRSHDPILSLVSKSFGRLVASPDLKAARSRIFNTERCLYVCLKFNNKPDPCWFILSLTDPKHNLIPIPSFPCPHPNRSTVVSTDSEIYMIGGVVVGKQKRSRRAYCLDCETNKWRQLPKMRIARREAAASVTDGKIYVYGGCSSEYNNSEYWGEIYDPKTQTWGLFPPGEVDVYNKVGVRSCNIIMCGTVFHDCGFQIGGKVYEDVADNGALHLCPDVCMVPIYHEWFQAKISNGKLQLVCCDDSTGWWGLDDEGLDGMVGGLEGIPSNLISVVNPDGRKRVIVWWKTYTTKECKTEIWCAEISFEIRKMFQLIWGVVEWSQNVFTFHGSESDSDSDFFLLHSALVTHGH